MEVTLKRLTGTEILSYYNRHIKKGKDREEKEYLLPDACISGLIARGSYKGYALLEGRKLIGLCFLIADRKDEVFLMHYFTIIKKYRGYNYAEILFELVCRLLNMENKERLEPALGIFFEVRGEAGEEAHNQSKRERELNFYKNLGAYMTDLIPGEKETYNVMFLPLFQEKTRAELKWYLHEIYRTILPSFREHEKLIRSYTE